MKKLDVFLQNWRIRKASKYILPKIKLVDIGAADGALLKKVSKNLKEAIGIEPALEKTKFYNNYKILSGYLANYTTELIDIDVITMLAVFEHIPPLEQKKIVEDCYKILNNNGIVIITVPSALVDAILHLLQFFKLIDGMSIHEHYGFEPKQTINIFNNGGFETIVNEKFQLGLNNLFVFRKKVNQK